MSSRQIAAEIEQEKLIAIIRADSADGLVQVAKALETGGCRLIELTMTTPNALEILKEASTALPNCVFGAGTVLDGPTARMAIYAGARYIVSPILDLGMIEMCRTYDVVSVPGAFTPTEMVTAWRAGTEFVKWYPANPIGPEFIKHLKGPLPQLKVIPTGAINLDNAAAFLKAGATAVAAGTELVGKGPITDQRLKDITDRARRFKALVGSV
ncbi:MAG: bifunctional 4-hydroxy-2-oxoglutarate aldolase/2-dehydro-3-deoxy-phosphogluconate aldolase [Phycisphaerae bacterium]|nr:bifunctional 4-hydroxy-2-oxoglutarate aldolase/2-dehydro-3-deoxy-phosphogluconate aldolase [Phycisphaerae bacterium]